MKSFGTHIATFIVFVLYTSFVYSSSALSDGDSDGDNAGIRSHVREIEVGNDGQGRTTLIEKQDGHNKYQPQLHYSTNATTTTTTTRPRVLPDMSSGGVVFFLHIPKSGGTTIRKNLEPVNRINYVFAKNYSTYYDNARIVEDAIVHGPLNQTIVFFEVHATSAPSFYKLRNRLSRWRTTAGRNNVPIFFFTLLRESISYAFSHFNFFHVETRNPTFTQVNATEENFLKLSLIDPQCQFLYGGEASMRAQRAKSNGTFVDRSVAVQPDQCYQIQNRMIELLDWVGTTERLSNETFPLLERLLNLDTNQDNDNNSSRETAVVDHDHDNNDNSNEGVAHTYQWQKHKVSEVKFGIKNVTAATIETIHSMSTSDKELYETVGVHHFRFEDYT